ncbi:MAG: ferrochelatase [Nitrospiraceae bacterium]|nr:MAG: ferrochelatase [Nitrospiraceae bacterium]
MIKDNKEHIGVVLLNLGGPDSLDAVRPFLYNLFSDRDIIRLGPSFLQKPIAWLISTFRSQKTRDMYSQIGNKSPILDITTAQAQALEQALNESTGSAPHFMSYLGMRYWKPFMADTVSTMIQDGISQVIVLSLYPHYSKATTGSSVTDFNKAIEGKNIEASYINEWYNFPSYIDSLAELISEGIDEYKGDDFEILFSAHSLPQSFIDEGDPYLDQIKETIKSVTARLGDAPYNLKHLKHHLSFQSKTGPVKWLEPSTEETILMLGSKGIRNLFVVPISFVSDHIETLYEIDILYKDFAREQGVSLKRCRSLNTSATFIHALRDLVLSTLQKRNGKGQ